MTIQAFPILGDIETPQHSAPGTPPTGRVRLAVGTDFVLRWVDPAGNVYSAANGQAFSDHLNDLDPFSHLASAIGSSSTVGTGNVEDDLSSLDSTKSDATVVTALRGDLDDLVAGMDSWFYDDFRWSRDVATTGLIGETGWFRSGGISSVATLLGTASAPSASPGAVRISTGTTANTWAVLYKPAWINPVWGGDWVMEMAGLNIVVNSNLTWRMGLATDPTGFPSTTDPGTVTADGVYLEKLTSDSTVWNIVTRIAGTQVRTASAVSLPATSVLARVRFYKASSTTVAVQISTAGGAWSTPEIVTYNPASILLAPFFGVKNSTTTARNGEIDVCSVIQRNLLRNG